MIDPAVLSGLDMAATQVMPRAAILGGDAAHRAYAIRQPFVANVGSNRVNK